MKRESFQSRASELSLQRGIGKEEKESDTPLIDDWLPWMVLDRAKEDESGLEAVMLKLSYAFFLPNNEFSPAKGLDKD